MFSPGALIRQQYLDNLTSSITNRAHLHYTGEVLCFLAVITHIPDQNLQPDVSALPSVRQLKQFITELMIGIIPAHFCIEAECIQSFEIPCTGQTFLEVRDDNTRPGLVFLFE